jgi:hypothetical protein
MYPIILTTTSTPRNLIHQTLRCRPNAQHRHAPRSDLRPPHIINRLRRDPQTVRLAKQLEHLVHALDLHHDLGLAVPLPLPQEPRVGGERVALCCCEQRLVAGQCCAAELRCDFTCLSSR